MTVITSKYLVPKGYAAITLYPFIFVRNRQPAGPVLLNHERIHLRQQAELLVIFFYLWYVTEYLLRLMHYKNSKAAYLNISFEREAYRNEHNMQYLHKRRLFNFYRHIKH